MKLIVLLTMIVVVTSMIKVQSLISSPTSSSSSSSPKKPDPEMVPAFARWLVKQSSWGVLITLDKKNAPFGNVVSYSVGPTGIPYFFLTTTLDPMGINALENPISSLAVSEYPLGTCKAGDDPQSPTCSKITLNGELNLVKQKSAEEKEARKSLFADHPKLAGWPAVKGNGFRVFRLDVTYIFLVNAPKPPRNITVAEYLSA